GLAAHDQACIYYHYERGGGSHCAHRVLVNLLRFRIKAVFQHPLGADTLRAIGSLAAEFATTVPRLPFWEWNYRPNGRKQTGGSVPAGEDGSRHQLAPDHR